MSRFFSHFAKGVALALLAALGGCASLATDQAQREQKLQAFAQDTQDPLEPMNRAFLQGNLLFYQGIERPLAGAYMALVPGVVRDRITNGVRNLEEPRIFINDVLQGRGQAAATTFGRFALNSTFGVAGMFDLATASGMPRQTGDFGQTLFVWGIEPGPYVVLPVLGPATFRDGIGRSVDPSLNPTSYAIYYWGGLWPSVAVGGFAALSSAAGLDDVLAGSLDVYPRLRSLYLQKRASELADAVGVTLTPQTEMVDVPPAPAAKPKRHSAKTAQKQAKAKQ
jgi:phospholipid-binding lipoprotein MlaA